MRSTLRHLTAVRGVLAAGIFDERGTRLAVCGRAPALAALTFADAHPSFASGLEPDEFEVLARDDFSGGRVVAYPLASGVLEIVVDVRADQVDPALASHVEAAARALDLVLAPLEESSQFDAIDGIGTVGCQGPNSETIPCFTRPPGY